MVFIMKKFFKISLMTIIISFLILLIKNQYTCLLLSNSSYGMPALIKQTQIDNLFLGSSMFRQGIDIITLEKTNSNSNWILAYNGNQPALEYYQLEKLLKHNTRIQNLYIDMYVFSAWQAPEISDEKLFLEIDLSEKMKLWELINTASLSSKFETFWRMFVSSNNELLLTWPLSSPIISSQFHHGGTLIKTASASSEALASSSVPEIKNNIHPCQKNYLIRLIQLAKKHNINIIFLETPKYDKIANDKNYLSAMQKYSELLDSEQIPYILSQNTRDKLKLPSSVQSYAFDVSNNEYFMDSIHLSSTGRRIFTSIIPLPQ